MMLIMPHLEVSFAAFLEGLPSGRKKSTSLLCRPTDGFEIMNLSNLESFIFAVISWSMECDTDYSAMSILQWQIEIKITCSRLINY